MMRNIGWLDEQGVNCWGNPETKMLHRIDGPAQETADSFSFWIYGEELTAQEWAAHPLVIQYLQNIHMMKRLRLEK